MTKDLDKRLEMIEASLACIKEDMHVTAHEQRYMIRKLGDVFFYLGRIAERLFPEEVSKDHNQLRKENKND